ncbi:MAG: PKD domain-containing protein [Candidatus Bathyarchaeia archaeon]|jgi:PKD repeat protein
MRTKIGGKQSLGFLFTCLFLLTLFTAQCNTASGMASIDWETHPYIPRVGETVVFNTTNSNIWANETFGPLYYAYSWDFGDGSEVANGDVVSHTYSSPGNYTISMNTTDKTTGQWGGTQRILTVKERTPLIVYASLNSDRVLIGQDAIISGNLTNDLTGEGVYGETLQLFWNTNPWEENWREIGQVKTGDGGEFLVTWKPPESNKFQIRVSWAGNASYPPTSSYVILTVFRLGDLITGFNSNSTITKLNFNLTTQLLTFSVSGPDDTKGYVNITLNKNSAFNPQNIIVQIDNNTIPYTYSSLDENTWLVTINYSHSIHDVLVSLNRNTIPEYPTASFIVTVIIALTMLSAVLLKKQDKLKRQSTANKYRVPMRTKLITILIVMFVSLIMAPFCVTQSVANPDMWQPPR